MSTSQPEWGTVAFGFALTVLLNSAIFWASSKIFVDVGLFEVPLRWSQSGLLALCYVASKLWMAAIVSGRGK